MALLLPCTTPRRVTSRKAQPGGFTGWKDRRVKMKRQTNTTRTAIAFLLAFSFMFPAQVNSTSSPLVRVAALKRKPVTPREIIKKWTDFYGVDNDLAVRIAHAESSLSCTVQNKQSSAGGLFQFTNATFL